MREPGVAGCHGLPCGFTDTSILGPRAGGNGRSLARSRHSGNATRKSRWSAWNREGPAHSLLTGRFGQRRRPRLTTGAWLPPTLTPDTDPAYTDITPPRLNSYQPTPYGFRVQARRGHRARSRAEGLATTPAPPRTNGRRCSVRSTPAPGRNPPPGWPPPVPRPARRPAGPPRPFRRGRGRVPATAALTPTVQPGGSTQGKPRSRIGTTPPIPVSSRAEQGSHRMAERRGRPRFLPVAGTPVVPLETPTAPRGPGRPAAPHRGVRPWAPPVSTSRT